MTRHATRIHFRHGRVLTPTGVVDGLVVEDGTVRWAGAGDPPGECAQVVDLAGRLVTPAFVDAHVHLGSTGFALLGADLSAARSAEEALHTLAAHARTTRLPLVLGHGWDETGWPDHRIFARAELDEAVGGLPAYVSRVDVHSAMASSALVAMAGGDALRTLPGWTDHGPLTREAHHAVREAQRALVGPADRAAAIRLALQSAAARGIGLVHELGAPHINEAEDLELLRQLRRDEEQDGAALPDVVGYWGELGALDAVRARGCEGAAGDICMDGSIGSRTAALHAPYADDPGSGYLYLTAEQVRDHVVACTDAGVQAGFHVIGDRAASEVMAGFDAAARVLGADAVRAGRHRLEHVEMLASRDVEAMARHSLTASMQPMFDGLWGGPGGVYDQRLGGRRAGMNAFATLAAAGVPLAFGSDSPITPFDPWAAVRAAVHHHDPRERIGIAAAFAAHTVGGWRAARRDDPGTLAPGAPAHLAVWDVAGGLGPDGLPSLEPEQPLPLCVLTLVAGTVAYDAGGLLT